MNYVIMDMEWNQPVSYDSHVYRQVGDRLIFEVIQIGAVKLDESLNIVDSISLPVKPTHYVRIHPRIRRMTGLDAEVFEEAPYFSEAIERFADWCGEQYALLTWGCDDVSVLNQNMTFFECETQLAPLYDIQMLFSEAFEHGKDRKGLSSAMEFLGIEQDEQRTFHNALHDAYYTALVFQKLPEPEKVLKFRETPRPLIHMNRRDRTMRNKKRYDSLNAAFQSDEAVCAPCPVCKKKTEPDGRYIRQAGNKYVGLLRCEAHGPVFAQLTFAPEEGGAVWMSATTSLANKLKVAYIHTKQLQPIPVDDPMQALLACGRTDMPFED